jgi:hypothetical protein
VASSGSCDEDRYRRHAPILWTERRDAVRVGTSATRLSKPTRPGCPGPVDRVRTRRLSRRAAARRSPRAGTARMR